MTGIINLFRGQVRVRAECAFPERVLNLCGAQGLAFWDLEWESPTAFTCRLSRRDWKALRQAGRNLDCAFSVMGVEGAPYFLLRFRHRQVLAVGLAACALGLTAWLWLPTFLAMFNGKFSGGSMGYDGLLACTPLDILGQLRMGQYRSISYGAAPYIFCGTAALVLAAAYFFFRRFPLREKISNGAMLAVLGLSMLLSPLDKAWHLFQRPNWFPFRYSFVVSFALVYLAVQALPQMLKKLKGRAGARGAQGVAAALVCLTVLELLVNTTSILMDLEKQFGSVSYRAYREYYAANGALTEIARKDSGEGFFRMGAAEDRGHNSPLSFGYPGITHYSSLYNYDVNHLTRELGFAQSWMWCAYYGSTPATDALFGIQYVISEDDMPPGYMSAAQVGALTLWKTPDALPIAFLTDGIIRIPLPAASRLSVFLPFQPLFYHGNLLARQLLPVNCRLAQLVYHMVFQIIHQMNL